MTMWGEPTVFVVDDNSGVREGLRMLTESVGLDAELYASAEEFLCAYDPDRPGCLVLDVRMPGMSGLDVLEQLPTNRINVPVIILTGHGDVPVATRAFKAGVIDFIEKPFQEQVLLDSIRKAIQHDVEVRQAQVQAKDTASKLATLTPREHEVMDRVVAGESTKMIAAALGISGKTIDFHRAKIMEKMQTQSLAELVRMVLAVEKANP